MNRFLSSKLFVALSTAATLALSVFFGFLKSYETHANTMGGAYGVFTTTKVVMNPKLLLGYICLSLVLSFIVFLLCVLVRKSYLSGDQK